MFCIISSQEAKIFVDNFLVIMKLLPCTCHKTQRRLSHPAATAICLPTAKQRSRPNQFLILQLCLILTMAGSKCLLWETEWIILSHVQKEILQKQKFISMFLLRKTALIAYFKGSSEIRYILLPSLITPYIIKLFTFISFVEWLLLFWLESTSCYNYYTVKRRNRFVSLLIIERHILNMFYIPIFPIVLLQNCYINVGIIEENYSKFVAQLRILKFSKK